MRIFIVEDDPVLADSLLFSMKRAGHVAGLAANGAEAAAILVQESYDLVILDLGLPGMSGFQVLKRLREAGNHVPVLILTAQDAIENRVKGLDLGADDYLTKPFDLSELEARMRALLRRTSYKNSNQIHLGPLCFETAGRRAVVGENVIELSARETCVLESLILRTGLVVSKEQIRENLHGWDEDVSDNAIEVYVHRLRKKLEESGIVIRAIRGLGYLMSCSNDA
jgi:DNA-binding response OmpR family regulator